MQMAVPYGMIPLSEGIRPFHAFITLNEEETPIMKITSFNPIIVTRDAGPVIKLFEELGFERRHTKEGIGRDAVTDIRMKDANGFYVDVSQGTGEWTMIRMNVDNLEEAISFLEAHGFHKARHEVAKDTIDTGSSRFNIMVSASGFILAVSQHIREDD